MGHLNMAKAKTRKVWLRLEIKDDYETVEAHPSKAEADYEGFESDVRAVYVIPVEVPEPASADVVVLSKVTA